MYIAEIAVSALTVVLFPLIVKTAPAMAEDKIFREGTEWFQSNTPNAVSVDKPRVLLIGDSITAQYYGAVRTLLQEKAYCSYIATSAAIADPVFLQQMEPMFSGYEYAVIHFNNGLHGWDYTEEEYRAGYERTLDFFRKKAPQSRLIIVLSTPVKPGSNVDNRLNPRVDARNKIVRDIAKNLSLEVNDLHSISKDKPDIYSDNFHYKKEAVDLQARQVADKILKVIGEKQDVR